MKLIIILADGMADEPIAALNNKTPLQAANTPYMDMLARKGRNGLLNTVPEGFSPGARLPTCRYWDTTYLRFMKGVAFLKQQAWVWISCQERW